MTHSTAVLLTAEGETAQDLLEGFALSLRAKGLRVGGLVQHSHYNAEGELTAMEMVDLETGATLPIEQNLGSGAACSIDPQAMAAASQTVRRAVEQGFDLVVVNKFGHLEVDGGGLADETMLAMVEGRPLLLSVSPKYLDRWQSFCGGQCELLPLEAAALETWWLGLQAP